MSYAPSHPDHDRESCSDIDPINADASGSHGCARCTALLMDRAKRAEAERDSLRSLLQKARDKHVPEFCRLGERIDAALKGTP